MARILTEDVSTARDFLRTLSHIDGFFPADYRQSYIFRGAGSEKYALVPSAFRDGTALRSHQQSVTTPLRTVGETIRAEISTLWEFFRVADREGLRLPEDSQDWRETFARYASVREDLFKLIEAGKELWPPNRLLSLMALAQHYGVPTRLLDWTWNSHIAAYFAATNAAKGAEKICVWAFSTTNDVVQGLAVPSEMRKLRLVSAPASDNENLRAQRWVGLIYSHSGLSMRTPLVRLSYDELSDESYISDPIFWKVTLPTPEAGELLRLLSILDIDAATVFPGFKGAAMAVNEMSRWPDQGLWRESGLARSYWDENEALWRRHHLHEPAGPSNSEGT